MQRQHWIDSVRQELRRRHLPPAYIARLMGELTDHAEDLQLHAEDSSARSVPLEQSLGAPRDVAQAALVKYRQTRFAGRHPVLVFILLPVPLTFTILLGVCLLVALIGSSLFPALDSSAPLMQTCRFAIILPATILPAALLCRIAYRAAIGLIWRAVACSLLAASAACVCSMVMAPSLTGHGRLSIGLGLPVTLLQWLQACLPLAMVAWSYRRSRRPRPVELAAT